MKSLPFKFNSLFMASACLATTLATGVVHADALHLAAASSTTNKLYEVPVPSGPNATLLGLQPLQPKPNVSVKSLVYVPNEQTSKIDLLAADTTGGRIVRYAAATTATNVAPQVLWAWPVVGPRGTDGLSIDAGGNLFVVSSDPARAELWVLRKDPALKPGGGFLPPLRIDNRYGSTNTLRLLDTVVVRTATAGGLGAGDVLVLANDGRVLRYSAASIKVFLAGAAQSPAAPPAIASPQVLIDGSKFPGGSVGVHVPTGMDLWPTVNSLLDGNLLISTAGGWILRFNFDNNLGNPVSTRVSNFSTGLGTSLAKVRTFVKTGVAYALVSRTTPSQILELTAPSGACPDATTPACNSPQQPIVTNVADPVGLAVTDSSSVLTVSCITDSNLNLDPGCTLLGGAIKHGVTSADSGASLLDEQCVVDPDPRWVGNSCTAVALPVEQVCPGFGNTVIPKHLCGGGGVLGKGFALVKTVETGAGPAVNNLLITAEVSSDKILGANGAQCPEITAGWAPLSAGEGIILEQPFMMELTGFCGTSRILPPGKSLIGIGLTLNLAGLDGGLVGFANDKLDKLSQTVAATPNYLDAQARTDLLSCVTTTQSYLNNANVSPATRYACAAHQAWVCDSQKVSAANFGPNPGGFSAYSAIRGRLANIILTIDNRLGGHPASQVWPLLDPGVPAVSCDDDTPPTRPGTPSPTSTGTSVTLNWGASTDNNAIGGYDVYRMASDELVFTKIASVAGTTYYDGAVDAYPSTKTYSYYVVAFDTATPANHSAQSVTISGVKTVDNVPPTAPSLSATSTATSVTLNWTASSDPPNPGVGGYDVWRDGGSGFTRIATGLPGAAITYTDSTVAPYPSTTAYSYFVVAFDAAQPPNSTASNTVPGIKVVDNVPPPAPTGLTTSNVRSQTLTLKWTAVTDPSPGAGVGGYYVIRNNVQIKDVAAPLTQPTTYSINDSGLTQSTTYTYEVRAYDKATPKNVSVNNQQITVKTCYDPDNDNDCH